MKPLVFLAAVAPPIAMATTVIALLGITSWIVALAVFYGTVATAQIAYLIVMVARLGRPGLAYGKEQRAASSGASL